MVTEDDFRKLFEHEELLDKSSSVPHIQESVRSRSITICKWLDAVYIGEDNNLYFLVTDWREDIKTLRFNECNNRDLQTMYERICARIQ